MFNDKHPRRFRSIAVSKHIPEKLLVNNTLITGPSCVLSTWAEHFESLSKSQITSSVPLTEIQKRVQDMERCSFNERDILLDVPFDVKEVEHVTVSIYIPVTMTLRKLSTRWNSASCWSS